MCEISTEGLVQNDGLIYAPITQWHSQEFMMTEFEIDIKYLVFG